MTGWTYMQRTTTPDGVVVPLTVLLDRADQWVKRKAFELDAPVVSQTFTCEDDCAVLRVEFNTKESDL